MLGQHQDNKIRPPQLFLLIPRVYRCTECVVLPRAQPMIRILDYYSSQENPRRTWRRREISWGGVIEVSHGHPGEKNAKPTDCSNLAG